MNIVRAFVDYLESLSFGNFGTDIFIGGVPQSAPDKCMWLLSSGGSPTNRNETNEMVKRYVVNVFYRNTDQEDVYDTLQEIEEAINGDSCVNLTGYDTLSMEATNFPTDQDLDNEDRTVGLLQVTITVYDDNTPAVS
jgi:hypothetical protein